MYKIIFLCLLSQAYGLSDDKPEQKQVDDTTRIIGGTEAENGKYPYQVSLRNNSNFHFCGGSILTKRWVLSAAHCTTGLPLWYYHVIAGTNMLNQGGEKYEIDKVTGHSKFIAKPLKNDISLIKLKKEMVFKRTIGRIGLPTEDTGADENVLLTGWGYTSYPGTSSPNRMRKINLTTISVGSCRKRKNVDSSQICTFTKPGEGACLGDSGGPLVLQNHIVGIVSYGTPCAVGTPDVFTRVWHFKTWIEDQMKT